MLLRLPSARGADARLWPIRREWRERRDAAARRPHEPGGERAGAQVPCSATTGSAAAYAAYAATAAAAAATTDGIRISSPAVHISVVSARTAVKGL